MRERTLPSTIVADAQHQAAQDGRVDSLREFDAAPGGLFDPRGDLLLVVGVSSTAEVTSRLTTAASAAASSSYCCCSSVRRRSGRLQQELQRVGHERLGVARELDHAPAAWRHLDLRVVEHAAQRTRRRRSP